MEIDIKDRAILSDDEIKKVVELVFNIWPPKDKAFTPERQMNYYMKKKLALFDKLLLILNQHILIGHAEIFEREIRIDSTTSKSILALAGVCVRPEYRGKGLGLKLVKRAFTFIDNGPFECSIFQTQIPEFYFKLGCRILGNTFINSKHSKDKLKNPWWDPHVMVYPAEQNFGSSIIDLNGYGY